MLDPAGVFDMAASRPDLGRPVLVHAMNGFVDAGSATKLTCDHLLSTLDSEVVATFDVDQLFDYRARRPEMLFAADHWDSYNAPQLQVHAIWDSVGSPFLLLAGPEPDIQWERFTAAVKAIVQELDVRLLIGLNSIPMGVPHTRPPTVIAHGRPAELVAEYRNWLSTVQVPASAGHLLEFRLGEAGFNSMGFAANVPHYLAHLHYPAAALSLLECVARAAELEIGVGALVTAAASTRAEVDTQVEASAEIAGVVQTLEEQYDAMLAGQGGSLVAEGGSLPTADEIGAEFERYLSQQPDPGDNPPA